MKILVNEITESPREVNFSERMDELNRIDAESKVRDFSFPPFLDVSFVYYRSGQELFFQGWFSGAIEGCCGRCLKKYSFPVEKKFDFVLIPSPNSAKSGELNRGEMGLSFYASEEIDLSPFIREQVLLALPMRPLCEASCRGLCPSCGINLNGEACVCISPSGDPRMAFFRSLKLDQ